MTAVLTAEQMSGVYAKLKRADEHIFNLANEIGDFMAVKPDGGFSKDNHEAADEFVDIHFHRPIPERFSVIAGEVAHHLRSSLDQIAWLLSSEEYRRVRETAIGFPVFTRKPGSTGIQQVNKDELARYNRQVKGITNIEALRLIELSQPYHAPEPANHPLAVVHEMNRVDKHHNLVLVERRFDMNISIPTSWFADFVIRPTGQTDSDGFVEAFMQKAQIQISTHIAFEWFGQRKNQTVIPSLMQLAREIKDIVGQFGYEH